MSEPMRIRATVRDGVADVRILMMHAMETGLRRDSAGSVVPSHYITDVRVNLNGARAVNVRWGPSVSRNPFLGLRLTGVKVGDQLSVTWLDNRGDQRSDSIVVSAA
jgi:sulfur-oxidizing protein SoxZ